MSLLRITNRQITFEYTAGKLTDKLLDIPCDPKILEMMKIRFYYLFLILVSLSAKLNGETPDATSSQNIARQKIAIHDSIVASGKFVERLDSASFYNLPVAILGGSNTDPSYCIAIDQVKLYPTYATFDASMVLTNPFDSSKIVFVARNVAFTFKGGIQGSYRLELAGESGINVCKNIGLSILPGSYAECDCHGFRSLSLKGKVELSEKMFVPADDKGNRKIGKVSSYFETNIQNWNDLTFSISFDPFQLKDYPDFTFICTDLAVDMSDYQNPSALKFPVGYEPSYPASDIELWRGIYIGNASVVLSKKFKNKESDAPLSIGVQNLIIDEQGFSGKVTVTNLLSLDKGSIGGWNFSVDRFSLQFIANNLVAGGLAGQIHVPAFADSVNFNYAASIDAAGAYAFTVSPASDLPFSLFGQSKLTLYKTSYISITSDTSGFVPVVNLTGKMTINASLSGSSTDTESFKIADLDFQNLRISTREPFVDIEYMAYTGSNKGALAKFPLTISDIAFRRTSAGANLSISARVNLKGDSEEGFGGSTTLTLKADRDGYKYKFTGVQVDKISVNVSKPGVFSIKGSIAFKRGDITYGNGFRGELKAEFSSIGVDALAIFGNVNGFRYFFVDAFVTSKNGIQAGPITIFGLGGGLYYHMRQQEGTVEDGSFGASLTGIVYKPDQSISIGFKASATFGVVNPQIINGEVLFEMVFLSSGGLSDISFKGGASCVTPSLSIDASAFKSRSKSLVGSGALPSSIKLSGSITAFISMEKDFESGDFHAEMNMKVNIANAIKGIGEDNKAGWAVLHASKGEWYLYIGTPADPIGIEILGMVKTSAYFMAGYNLPAAFAIHPKVAEILGLTEEQVAATRSESNIKTGKGIAFGASYSISTGDISFLTFYANFSLGMGFDLSLMDYGSNAYCAGSNPPLGINGWYAKGQAYAYFSGSIGIQVKVFRKKKKFEILSIATAAYLRAEGPNPVWMIGYVGGQYRILGGMVKGKCNFKVEVGKKCDIQKPSSESALADLQLIGDVSPETNASDVDIFTTPQVVFNVPVNTEQKISEDNGSSTFYRVNVSRLTLTQGSDTVPYTTAWNSGNDVVQLIPNAILNPKTSYNLKVAIKFEEKVNGVWKDFMEDNAPLIEEKSISFMTGELPDKIPASEITYTYPVDRQYNFMPGEYNKAYMMFRRDVHVFFDPSPTYTKKARWTQGGTSSLSDITYNAAEKTLYMGLPGSMGLNRIYKMELAAIPVASSGNVDRNVASSVNRSSQDSTSTEITTKSAEGTITTTEEKVMYSCNFRTSRYNNFASRFSATDVQVRALYDRGYMEFYLVTAMPGGEGFDDFELNGVKSGNPLISMTADLGNTPWFTSDVNPKTYQNYPWFDMKPIYYRDTTIYGLRAEKAITAWQTTGFSKLTDAEVETGTSMNDVSFIDMAYMPAYYWNEDYMSIRDGLAYYAKTNDVSGNAVIQDILTRIKLRAIKPGSYPVKLSYMLPGKNLVTSSKNINLISTIKTDASDL